MRIHPRVVAGGGAFFAAYAGWTYLAGGGLPSAFGYATVPCLLLAAGLFGGYVFRPWSRLASTWGPAMFTIGALSRAASAASRMLAGERNLTQALAVAIWVWLAFVAVVLWEYVFSPFSIRERVARGLAPREKGGVAKCP